MNHLSNAAEVLKDRWIKSQYCRIQDGIPKFCSIGAIGYSMAQEQGIEIPDFASPEYDAFFDKVCLSDEVKVLGQVVKANYPDTWMGKYREDATVIEFNDDIAEDVNEVIAMFEKAAVLWDELS